MQDRETALKDGLRHLARDIGTVREVAGRRSLQDDEYRAILTRLGRWRNEVLHAVDLLASPLSAPPQEPTGASPQAETSEDEDDVPAVDSWSAPLRKPVVPKILSTDDFYALLRILEVLPVADPFLTDLQAKLSDEERRQHGNRASRLSGPEFVREIERIEALIQSRQLAPVSPVEPEPPTVECCACGHLNTPQQATRLEGEWRSSGEYVCLDSDACSRRIAKCSEPTVEPEPCVWRADWREGRDGSILVPSCQPEMEIDAAFVQECVQLHGWKFCVHCGAPLKVEREP